MVIFTPIPAEMIHFDEHNFQGCSLNYQPFSGFSLGSVHLGDKKPVGKGVPFQPFLLNRHAHLTSTPCQAATLQHFSKSSSVVSVRNDGDRGKFIVLTSGKSRLMKAAVDAKKGNV